MASRRQQSLLIAVLVVLFVVGSIFFAYKLRKIDKRRAERSQVGSAFDDVVYKEYEKAERQQVQTVKAGEDDCRFGFTFLKSVLKSLLKQKKDNRYGDIIQPSRGGLRQGIFCIDSNDGSDGSLPQMQECHGQGRNQEWKITVKNTIENVGQEHMCLTAEPFVKEASILRECNASNHQQRWNFNARKGRFSPEKHTDLCLENIQPFVALKPCAEEGKASQEFEFIMTEIINLEDTVGSL